MQCPNCGNTDLLRKFKCCPECGSPLPHAQNIPSKIVHGVVPTLLQQSGASARENYEHGIDNSEIQGKLSLYTSLGFPWRSRSLSKTGLINLFNSWSPNREDTAYVFVFRLF